jgi:SAM-dependent methyltransferase
MSFSAEWLALREPCDHASVNPELRQALSAHYADRESLSIVDLGCGTGSNLRGTFAVLPARQHWTLVDYDPGLLSAAKTRLAGWADTSSAAAGGALELKKDGKAIAVSFREADLSNGSFAEVTRGADLVTAAALFDLVSVLVIERLADALAAAQQVFFTVLTYDGYTRWTPAHAADEAVRAAFNAHQKSDKGFGPAAGPDSTTALAKAFYARGYRVLRGTSPWVVDQRYGTLRDELDKGFANAAAESGQLSRETANQWLANRHGRPDAVSVIGHEDLLALPAS